VFRVRRLVALLALAASGIGAFALPAAADPSQVQGCPSPDHGFAAFIPTADTGNAADRNGDGVVCVVHTRGGDVAVIDNNLPQ
jgi:hypothetical protein